MPTSPGDTLNLLLRVRALLDGERVRWWLDFEALLRAWCNGACAACIDIGVQGRGQISYEKTSEVILETLSGDPTLALSGDVSDGLLTVEEPTSGATINLLLWSERFDIAELECKHASTVNCNFPSAYLHPMQAVEIGGHSLPCPNGANLFLRGRFGKSWDDDSIDRSLEKNGGSREWNTHKDTVITFGTYDMFHVGHLNVLQRAAFLGPVYAGVSSDRLNYSKKQKLPMCSDRARMRIVSAIRGVSGAFLEDSLEDKPEYVKAVGATLFVMGSDWDGKRLPWGQTMDEQLAGLCECMYFPRTMGVSTTELRQKAAAQENLDQAEAAAGTSAADEEEGLDSSPSSPTSSPTSSPSKARIDSQQPAADDTVPALSSAMEAASVSAGDAISVRFLSDWEQDSN